jgi:ankyrin repeat protein
MNRKTKLLEAIKSEKTKSIEKLLKPSLFGIIEAVKVNATYGFSETFTPLIFAVQKGKLFSVKQLIKCGANINQTDNYGNTPLIMASKYGHAKIVQLLIENNADVNIKNNYCDTALTIAANKNFAERSNSRKDIIVDMLLSNGSDINAQNKNNETPLIIATNNGDVVIVGKLINSGADINKTDFKGFSALQLAISYAYKEGIYTDIVKLLATNSDTVNMQFSNGKTPVKLALNMGHTKIADWLIAHGAIISPEEKGLIEADRRKIQETLESGYFCNNCGCYKSEDETKEDSYDQDEWVTISYLSCKTCGGKITDTKGNRIITRAKN